jgi:hypothetical protein
MTHNHSNHSDFWLDNSNANLSDHITLAVQRRAISNFVTIVTGKNIPVKYRVEGQSCTDGKVVYISADLKEKNYDVAVGLALHEGSHIALTDFKVLTSLVDLIPNKLFDKSAMKGIDKSITTATVKDLWNYVEDRYIDNFIYKSSTGYRGYYRALYNKYFNDKDTSKALKSEDYREETIENYMFRIINLTNPGTELHALGGLLDIAKEIGFSKLERLSKTKDRLDVALKLYEIILDNIGGNKKSKKTKQDYSFIPNSGKSDDNWPSKFDDMEDLMVDDSEEESNDSNDDDNMFDSDGGDFDDLFGGISTEVQKQEVDSKNDDADDKKSSLSKAVKERVEKHFDKIKDYMKGDVDKKELSKEDARSVNSIEESGTELIQVGENSRCKTDCVVINNLSDDLMNSNNFPMTDTKFGSKELVSNSSTRNSVDRGLQLGSLLGKKLKVRGESRVTKYSRKRAGKIDRRIISELGYDAESVFYKIDVDQYKKAFLHLSIDASSSMYGDKWTNSITCAVAIAKAASMIENLRVVISFRIVHSCGLPCIVMAYDSQRDKISKIKRMFPYLDSCGCTPEGLCFEAILDKIPAPSSDCDTYFLNFSDGEPNYGGRGQYYVGADAASHTKRQITHMKNKGVKVISYFISNNVSNDQTNLNMFRKMYGRDAEVIDVMDVAKVANVMNKKFLKK